MASYKCNICLVSPLKNFREKFIKKDALAHQGHHFPHIWKDLP